LVQLSLEPENSLGLEHILLSPFSFSYSYDLSQVELVDFGATRSYSSASINNWLRLLLAVAQQDREGCLRWSLKLGYLTGEENDVGCHSPPSVLRKVLIDWVDYIMNNAHVESLQLLATPFREDTPQPFTFGLV
jgi:aarF domain-containing kinase